jgi:hypothetical protein
VKKAVVTSFHTEESSAFTFANSGENPGSCGKNNL